MTLEYLRHPCMTKPHSVVLQKTNLNILTCLSKQFSIHQMSLLLSLVPLLLLLALQATVGFVFSVIFFHSALSLHNFLHSLILIIWISSSMSSIHLFLGLPLFLLPVGFHSSTLLGILFPSIRIT